MNSNEFKALAIAAVLFFLLATELVACQWHADTLTGGCATNALDCLNKKPH